MLENGFKSGCLVIVSNDFQSNYDSLLDTIKPLAISEWNRFDDWEIPFLSHDDKSNSFDIYYKLNKKEKDLFDVKQDMPKSFIKKFLTIQLKKRGFRFLKELSNMLYHKKNPNTENDLINALKNHKVYKVKCTTCNRIYYMDEESIKCVKWKSCIGADCLSTTIKTDNNKSYTNLCNVDNKSVIAHTLNTQLSIIENISDPLSYYGGFDTLHISYISDIHLMHHLKPRISLNMLLNTAIRKLYETMDEFGPIIFGGDISSNPNITMSFYKKFVQYNDYLSYKSEKDRFLELKNKSKTIETDKLKIETKFEYLKKYVAVLKESLAQYLDFNDIYQYKNKGRKKITWVSAIDKYKNGSSYKNINLNTDCDRLLDLIAHKLDALDCVETEYENFLSKYNNLKQKLDEIDYIYGKSIEELTISDVYTEHFLLSDERDIYAVLGNHEYIGFDTIKEAIDYYKPSLEELGILLLHNNYYEFSLDDNTCIIFGGSGFAKYNLEYNADTLKGCRLFTRQDEIKETTLFENAYKKAKKKTDDKLCFICVSHYPINDCFSSLDKDTIYFYGHNHQNYYHRNEHEIIYADNQIGYDNPNIAFKTMKTGIELNPYFTLNDGLYETSIKDYLQFYRHLGESIGDGSLLYQRCKNNNAKIYVIKRFGYYGFFLMNPNKGTSQGISIINGGKTKKITKSKDLQWLFDNFETVLFKYLKLLTPLRVYQEQISNEVKELGFLGTIHGCIVDIDFYHHIMINPYDGTTTFYYSSTFGYLQPLGSFDNVIESIQKHDDGLFKTNRNYVFIQQKYNEQKNNEDYLLGKINETFLLEESGRDATSHDYSDEEEISPSDSIYSISRRINTLQRLFTCRTLRDFDLRLVDIKPILDHRL